jgi:hypothetical protein
MNLRIRSYVIDQDVPLQTGQAMQVVAELVEVHGLEEEVVATMTGEYRWGEDLPSLTVRLNLTMAHVELLSYAGALLYGSHGD